MASSPALVTALTDTLASLYALYFRAHSAHWNVEGSQFVSLHAFFGDIYEDTFASIDAIAEDIRQLQSLAPSDLSTLLAQNGPMTTVTATTDAKTLLTEVDRRNTLVLSKLHAAYAVAEPVDEGIANFLQDRLRAHHKWAWQLQALLKG